MLGGSVKHTDNHRQSSLACHDIVGISPDLQFGVFILEICLRAHQLCFRISQPDVSLCHSSFQQLQLNLSRPAPQVTSALQLCTATSSAAVADMHLARMQEVLHGVQVMIRFLSALQTAAVQFANCLP